MSQKSNKIIHGPGYIAKKLTQGYEIEFDPGAHTPQETKVRLTDEEFSQLRKTPGEFQKIVASVMEEQGIKIT